jgi:FHA domain/Domain of unknown function (DUF1707)
LRSARDRSRIRGVRASGRARQRIVAALTRAANEGLLSFDTLSLRLEAAFAAREVQRLDALVGDLPVRRRPPGALLRRAARWLTLPADLLDRPDVLRLPPGKDVMVVGRDPGCDVCLPDRSISRRHAQLHREPGCWYVLDLSSTNGTWLNGRLIEAAYGQPGDELTLADRRLVLPPA